MGLVRRILVAAVLLLVLFPAAGSAGSIVLPTHVGAQTFDTNSFATSVVDSHCGSGCLIFGSGISVQMGPLSTLQIEPLVIGYDLSKGVGLGEGDYVVPAFGLLASIANGTGDDFVIWEAGTPSEQVLVSVSLGGGIFSAPISYLTQAVTPADSSSGYATNSVFIDLADFGIASGGLIDQVRIEGLFTGVGGSGPDVLAVAALNVGPPTTVPEPATLALLGIGLIGLARLRRRR